MTDAEKKILADLNARAEQTIDALLVKVIAHPASWVILLGFGLICAFIGGILHGKFFGC
jgi:hypothetical protein